eukprot:1146222-Pelagomonas_calceolata.AAC.2
MSPSGSSRRVNEKSTCKFREEEAHCNECVGVINKGIHTQMRTLYALHQERRAHTAYKSQSTDWKQSKHHGKLYRPMICKFISLYPPTKAAEREH